MIEAVLYYLLLGALAGAVAGLLGIGGGLIIVPALASIFAAQGFDSEIIMHLALGTSLATIVVTSISSILTHHRRGAVMWPVVTRLSGGIVVGAMAGAIMAEQLSSVWLQKLFALFTLLVAAQMALAWWPQGARQLPGRVALAGVGGAIGLVSAVVGIGGGTMTTPFLLWCNSTTRSAIATSAACGLPIALAGAVGYWLVGLGSDLLPANSSGYIYWPALLGVVASSVIFASLGARLTHHLPAAFLKKGFSLLLLVIGLNLLWV